MPEGTASGKVRGGSKRRRLILIRLRKSKGASGPRAEEAKGRQTRGDERSEGETHYIHCCLTTFTLR